jgi:hypothetical protein
VLTEDEIATLCTAGAMAPSGGNEQPWRVTVNGNRMLIRSDDQRGDNSFLDVDGYAANFAIGCFAENVAITAQSLGLEYTEDGSDGTVEFTFTGRRTAWPHELSESIAERVTNRQPGDGTELTDAELQPLLATVDPAYQVTAVSTPDAKALVGRALGNADVVRMRNTTMFADMVREMCWSDRETADRRDGLDLRTLELPGATVKLLSLMRRVPWLRNLLPTSKLAETAQLLVTNSSHICCLSTQEPLTRDSMMVAGRSLQRLWLEATRAGLSVHPWTVSTLLLARLETFRGKGFTGREPQEVFTFGTNLRLGFGLLPQDHPVFVFRLFKSTPPAARSLRLPWQSFTTIQESADGAR